ncbi:hypothetical protein IMG5_118680 [Ichthyophthirius multifiliis]|uniref:Uncharacterized protein n=1 Tax=Ichthyophthirius multifiliis TaxID=5932 RepID=G0QUQ8_ICHMU|nr:hypothetical protein IMG5_118680 [Ichthyophthirius multifiliis]EGR31043.1 hypothetical protein IMG5_118680 [Ichthyophthirius multifiliis]|eukprot:XP_004034529.1 hypothetical protein IMG5_118680 [Ichthyophthirius multifiliis]
MENLEKINLLCKSQKRTQFKFQDILIIQQKIINSIRNLQMEFLRYYLRFHLLLLYRLILWQYKKYWIFVIKQWKNQENLQNRKKEFIIQKKKIIQIVKNQLNIIQMI